MTDTATIKELHSRHLHIGVDQRMNALTRVKSTVKWTVASYFHGGKYEWATVPQFGGIVASCEDFGTLFKLPYFGQDAYLGQTAQSHLELFCRGDIPKVWTLTKSSRAETEYPARRLTAFEMVEYEIQGATLMDVQSVQEQLLWLICDELLQHNYADLLTLGAPMARLTYLNRHFPRISYDNAIGILQRVGVDVHWGEDLRAEHEAVLTEQMGNVPYFIQHWPCSVKFFSMRTDPADERLCLSSDLILPGVGEAAGASERESDYHSLQQKLADYVTAPERVKAIKELGLTPGEVQEAYRWYLDIRKGDGYKGSGGSGIGLSRLLVWVLGCENIIDVEELPRNYAVLTP